MPKFKSAEDGKFVTEGKAKKNPDTTYKLGTKMPKPAAKPAVDKPKKAGK
jgi:hypothetical protein